MKSFLLSSALILFSVFSAWSQNYLWADTINFSVDQGITAMESDSAKTIEDSCFAFFTYEIVLDIVYFTNASIGSDSSEIISYAWDFCDGSTSSMENPIHGYLFPTFICACLEIIDVLGCTDEYCISITDTSMSILNIERSIKISPNPVVRNEFEIISSFPVKINSIVNITGQDMPFQVYQVDQTTYKIEIPQTPSGCYFVNFYLDEGEVSDGQLMDIKIIVQ